jgi:two-component system OmpR family sensor kinase
LRPTRAAQVESTLLRAICHEMRAPVASLGSLTRMLSDPDGGGTTECRSEMARLAHHQAVHLDALLAQARTAVGAVPRAQTRATLPLRRMLTAVGGVVPPGRLRVAITPRAANRRVPAGIVQQVLTNLLDNAVRHGARHVPVTLRAWTDRHGLRLVVHSLREPFGRAGARLSARQPPAGMSGLGLWIVGELVAGSGGSVRARTCARSVAVEVRLPSSDRCGIVLSSSR